MGKIFKKIILVTIMLGIMILPMSTVKATLQANPNTNGKGTKEPVNWVTSVRNMEKSGEAMGLNEKLGDDLTPTSDSNGIDMHMMRSTEYGAIAILSASGYGNSQTLQASAIKTSTGNKTGVYFPGVEATAGGITGIFPGVNADSRYYDLYIVGNSSSAKAGDALGTATSINPGCPGWHSAQYNHIWTTLGQSGGYKHIFRGLGGMFSNSVWIGTNGSQNGFCHGVASCGEGL